MKFILGFIAGEGSFQVDAHKRRGNVEVTPKFSIYLKGNDEELLREIQDEMGVGSVTDTGNGHIQLQARSKEDLTSVVEIIEDIESDMWDASNKRDKFDIWKNIVRIYDDGRTTKEQKIEMLEEAKKIRGDGRERKTSLEQHITDIEEER